MKDTIGFFFLWISKFFQPKIYRCFFGFCPTCKFKHLCKHLIDK